MDSCITLQYTTIVRVDSIWIGARLASVYRRMESMGYFEYYNTKIGHSEKCVQSSALDIYILATTIDFDTGLLYYTEKSLR